MIKLSKKTDYALVALSHLQVQRRPISAKEIADTYNLSLSMLANVLKSLSSAGLVASTRGSSGGYQLGRAPKLITLGEVVDLFDGQKSLSDCTSNETHCAAEGHCPAHSPMVMIHQRIKDFMHSISLADLAHPTLQGFYL